MTSLPQWTAAATRDLVDIGYQIGVESARPNIAARIVGYIRQAAIGDALVPYEQRVDGALQRILASKSWSTPQRQWLQKIAAQTKANLIVATQNNAARIAMSVDKAARNLVSGKDISEGLLNMVEMAFRAYDPCLGCATHSLPGSMPLFVRVLDRSGEVVSTLRRDADGAVTRS